MEEPSISGFNTWEIPSDPNLASLNLSLTNKIQMVDEDIEEDEIEEVEVDENERLNLQKVSSLVEAAFQRVEKFNKPPHMYVSSGVASEASSCGSTFLHAASLTESLDGGKAEVEELKNLPPTFESALRINQALQRRLTATLNRFEKTLQQNILRQEQLKEEEEEQGLLNSQDKDCKESRNKYFARPSSFAVPYFKDRTGMPAPMNADAKYKVDHGYLDLYSTRLRTWLTSEQNLLVKEVQKEWKNQLINDWNTSLKAEERKLKNPDISEEEREAVEEEVKTCRNHINFFTNVPAEKIDMPRGSKLDWDKVSAQAFDGFRSTEECQLLWENYMHPSVSRAPWTEEEDLQIQDIVLESKNQKVDWEELAQDLETGRTGFQVMKRWVSFIKPTIQPARWTPEASKKLEDTINMLRVGSHIPWAQVSQHITGYTKIQLQSRWKVINPEQARGPFTTEEDFVLIKGLYKFGMNFELIAHFLPGRSKVQVRQRFKRALLMGLTNKPWTWREDKKIIQNCSLDAQHWRRMGMVLPQRDTCQIRLRFYVLHFWQSISSENKLPPPLFPLSLTTKAGEVKKLRGKILKLNPDVKIYLDSIQNKSELMDKSVKPFEERRDAICKTLHPANLARFLQDKDADDASPSKRDSNPSPAKKVQRRANCGGYRSQSWPDKALKEFFLPGRTSSLSLAPAFDSTDEVLREHFHRVSQALQIRVRRPVSQADIDALSPALGMQNCDANLVNKVLVRHHDLKDYGTECLSCSSQNPEIIPLMPPHASTIGALRSLLLHKPKLEEMASAEFLLFQVPRSELYKLGTKPNTLNEEDVSRTQLKISEEEIVEYAEGEGEAGKRCPKHEDGAEGDPSESASRDEGEESPARVKRKAAAMADIVNYVYSREDKKPKLTKEPVKRKEAMYLPSEHELENMQLEGEEPTFRKRPVRNVDREEMIKEEDKLLFHRMLSLFFWPSVFTLIKPQKEIVYTSAELNNEKKMNEMELPDVISLSDGGKRNGKFNHMDIDEQAKIIQKMEAVKSRKSALFSKVYNDTSINITAEDLKKRIFKKNLKKLKRSLVMRKTWEKRRLGLLPPTTRKKSEPAMSARPMSSRLVALQTQRRKRLEDEERQLMRETDQEELSDTQELEHTDGVTQTDSF